MNKNTIARSENIEDCFKSTLLFMFIGDLYELQRGGRRREFGTRKNLSLQYFDFLKDIFSDKYSIENF